MCRKTQLSLQTNYRLKMKRAIVSLILSLLFVGLAASAEAWQIKLGDAYNASGYYAYDITFKGDATDNLSLVCLSIGYDKDDVSFVAVAYHDYDDGAVPVANDTWVGGGLPYSNDMANGLLYSIMGEEPLGTSDIFYPVAADQTLLFTVYFEAVAGAIIDDSSVYFVYGDDLNTLAADGIEINDSYYADHALSITANTITVAPVRVLVPVWIMLLL